MEALSRQIRAGQELRHPTAWIGPADQRDTATQTPASESKEEERLYHDLYVELRRRFWSLQQSQESQQGLAQRLESAGEEMRAWSSDSRQLRAMVEASFLHLQEDRQTLRQQQKQAGSLLSRCRALLQRWGRKRGEMARTLEAALKAKDAADLVRESVQACAAAQIRKLEQSAESRQSLWALLQEAKRLKADFSSGYASHVEQGDRLAAALQADWAQMRLDYEGCRSAVTKCLSATQRMGKEVEAARREGARHQEVCRKLEERTVEVVEALGRVNELVEANTRLDQDLQAALQKATALERQVEQLQEEQLALTQQQEEKAAAIQELQEEVAWLTREKERVEQERDSAQRDFREASDCREFIEQENQVVRRQLSETEEELKATLSTLRERSTQLEDHKDAQQKLRQELDSLHSELASARAGLRGTETGLEALSQAVLEMGALQAQFLEAKDFLQTARPGEAAQAAPRSSACTPGRRTPHRLGVSLVDSVLQAASQDAARTPGLWSETTAFTRIAPAAPPQPSQIRACLAANTQDLRRVAEQLCLLARHRQEEVQELQAQILQLEQQLENAQRQHQAELDACNAAHAKLSKALHLRIQSEKELQELLRQQEEKQDQLSDRRREVGTLQEEVAQLRLALQKSETAAATLWEELSGTQLPDVQEKIWLRQEVGKLKELLLQKDAEHTEALTSHVVQVRCLEDRLRQAQRLLRHQKAEAELKEALSLLPAEVSSLAEVQRLLDLLA
ncbi:sperm-associated antigen 5 [Python bivittatus]|uniref:Sperm-associated antigen 5 n=1 Tax=Python bivittatus TaxID=176946 RepID=A0A9F2WDP1_PYTBI|nr:sperm-associated antigen 5 [Python bivittatus]